MALGGFFAWSGTGFRTGRRPGSCSTWCAHDTLVIPGTAFLPGDRRMLRLSVGRIDERATTTLARRRATAEP